MTQASIAAQPPMEAYSRKHSPEWQVGVLLVNIAGPEGSMVDRWKHRTLF